MLPDPNDIHDIQNVFDALEQHDAHIVDDSSSAEAVLEQVFEECSDYEITAEDLYTTD